MAPGKSLKPSARLAAATALGQAAHRFPDIPVMELETAGLDPRDVQLARAIFRLGIGRFLTIEHLLDQFLRAPMHSLEPTLRGVLLSAGAQLLFMDRLPTHAVVDESVKLARQLVRPGAAGLVNAVLRRLAEQIGPFVAVESFVPGADRAPFEDGFVPLASPLLPDPSVGPAYWSAGTSHPVHLVRRWADTYGRDEACKVCLHGVRTPPIIVALEAPLAGGESANSPGEEQLFKPHARAGFAVWTGSHTQLKQFLSEHPARRVQDPASAAAVECTRELLPRVVVDFCAGRGTKTRQLAVTHPEARIVAHDPDGQRLEDLQRLTGTLKNVEVPSRSPVDVLPPHSADLVVLDVPCSNTGVLGRRPEARYRFNAQRLESLVQLQRVIVEQVGPLLAPGGHLLYSTCSLEPAENQEQRQWIIQRSGARLVTEELILPAGSGATYHTGGYYALLRLS